MKILLLTSHLRIGGIPVYVVTLANYLIKAGHTIYLASSGGELENELFKEVIRITAPLNTKSILSPKCWSTAFKLGRFVKAQKIDVIHAHTRVSQFSAWFISKMSGVPYVVTWHGFYRKHFFRRLLPCWGDRTIAISRAVERDLIEKFKRKKDKVRLVLNGVDASKFTDDYSALEKTMLRKKYGLSSAPIVGIICRLAPDKGHVYLAEAFKGVIDKISGAQLVIVGEGKSEPDIKKKVAELAIGKNVYFMGESLRVKEFLSIMDVVTRPSIEEGFGLAIVEAMLMGKPIVATDVGDFKEILNGGRAGMLVKAKDPLALKEALINVLTDTKMAEGLGLSAREYALANFTADRMASQIESVYKEVIDERRSTR